MKKTLFILSAVTVISMTACNKEDFKIIPSDETAEESNEEIVFRSNSFGASVETKSTNVITSLTSFNVNCVTGTAGTSEESVWNSAFSGTASFTGGKYWPIKDPKYKFYASNVTMTPSATGPTINAKTETDIVCAFQGNPKYKENNSLEFKHIFARISTCKITSPSDGSNVKSLKVTITPKTEGTYNIYKGNDKTDGTGWLSSNESSEVTLTSKVDDSTNNDLWLIPGEYTLKAIYTLTRSGYEEEFTKTANVSIVEGKINSINATLPNSNAQEITFTVSVKKWESNDISVDFK